MEYSENEKKFIISIIINFLTHQCRPCAFNAQEKHTVDIVTKFLKSAFNITSFDSKRLREIDLFSRVREYDQSNEQFAEIFGDFYNRNGDLAVADKEFEDAAAYYTYANKADPKKGKYLTNLATASLQHLENRYDVIIRDCKTALELDPTCCQTFDAMGLAYFRLERWEEAVNAYEQAVKLNPKNTSYQTNLAKAKEHYYASTNKVVHEPCDIVRPVKRRLKKPTNLREATNTNIEQLKEDGRKIKKQHSSDTNLYEL